MQVRAAIPICKVQADRVYRSRERAQIFRCSVARALGLVRAQVEALARAAA